jgi:ferredoxin
MRVIVDWDRCESNGVCVQAAPTVFEVRDDDQLYVLQETPSAELHDQVRDAVERCPRQALRLEEDEPAADG